MRLKITFLVFTLFFSSFLFFSNVEDAIARSPVTIEEGSPLPLRVLTRPKAVLYSDASEANPVQGQLPVFKPFYVYTRPGGEAAATGDGWYEVGINDEGTTVGWLKASDVFEWKQTMCLAYSHPEGRKPVLMFEDDYYLDELLKKVYDDRLVDVEKIYSDIDNASTTPLPSDFPIISVEPKMAVDISEQFYLLPILEHQTVTMESFEGRKLLLAAVSGKEDADREKVSDIRENTEYLQSAISDAETVKNKRVLEEVTIDVVFVMDTTRSMQPYIDNIRSVLTNFSTELASNPLLANKISFGVWGFRDSTEIKDIEYLTKNFTPELLNLNEFLPVLETVQETKIDSVDVQEDLFAGVHDAMTKTAWRPNSIKIIMLIADAPAHESGHKWNSSKLDQNTLRDLANEYKVSIFGIHVNPKIRKRYNNAANRQFTALTTNLGTTSSALWSLQSTEKDKFVDNSQVFTSGIVSSLASTVEGMLPGEKPTANTIKGKKPEKPQDDQPTVEDVENVLRAATVTWLGRETEVEAPSDIEAWVTDRDLADPSIQSLDVRLLVTKRQLDTMAVMLNDLINAGTEAQVSSEDFFTSLQSVSAAASRNADQLANVQTLQDSGLIPAFLQGLPYESQVMSMSSELWESLGPDEQDQFIENLRSKVAAYQSLHDSPDQWIALNAGDGTDDFVTPIPLDLLP